MKHQNKALSKKSALAASLYAMTLVSGAAHSAFIEQWTYSTDATFVADSATWSSGTGVQIESGYELSWGRSPTANPNPGDFQNPTSTSSLNRSALTVGDFSQTPETLTGGGGSLDMGSVITDENGVLVAGEIGKGVSLTHWNNVLDGGFSTLTGASIEDTLTLTPLVPLGGGSQSGPVLTFVFKFQETPNAGNGSGLCADGKSATADYGYSASGGGCPDLFGYQNLNVVDQGFNYDGFNYFVSVLTLNADGTLDTIGIANLEDNECTTIGLAAGCFGFRTLETTETTKRFGFAISSRRLSVPEPGTLALMGLALLGLGATRYRKAK
ncbi:MAG: PEP-CTERM sorting domain-containing protein [Thiobacillus sp.]|nr:PEP-CTERM sorting domain-containing protein [Thiobacillus sp.]